MNIYLAGRREYSRSQIMTVYAAALLLEKREERMKDNPTAFNSDSYEEKIGKTLPYYDEFYKQIVDVVRLYKSTPLTWLDVGCGTGKMAEMALGKIDMEQFVLCDCSEQMLQTAKMRLAGKNTVFRLSSVQELEYKEVFDVVTAVQVHHYLQKEERQRAIRNCYQALKAGGWSV